METKEKTCLVDLTKQEIFDRVAQHLFTQNEKALDEKGQCKYRFLKEDGIVLKCAAGAIIPDEYYHERFEKKMFHECDHNELIGSVQSLSRELFGFPMVNKDHEHLVHELQLVHDQWSLEEWTGKLLAISVRYNLNSEILNNHI